MAVVMLVVVVAVTVKKIYCIVKFFSSFTAPKARLKRRVEKFQFVPSRWFVEQKKKRSYECEKK